MKNSFAATERARVRHRPSRAPQGADRIDLDRHVPALCNTIGGYVSRHVLANCAQKHQLGILEWRILLTLGGESPLELGHLADRVAMDRGGCSRAVTGLEERGIVERVPSPSDRRRSPVQLTQAGLKLSSELARFARGAAEELLSVLAEHERAAVLDALNKLRLKAIEMYQDEWKPA